MNNKVFGKKLQSLRISRGMDIVDVAKYCDKSNGYIRTLESGNRLPSSKLLISLCKCLETTPNYLLSYVYSLDNSETEIAKRIILLTPHQKEVTFLLIQSYLGISYSLKKKGL